MIQLRPEPYDPHAELADYQAGALGGSGRFGATCVFVGTMRDFNEGDTVRAMLLEHYPGMTERELERIVAEAGQRWPLLDVLVIHRVGEILPDQAIVLVAVWSAHRGAAFDACRYIMEELKHRAPFWKRETLEEGARWVARNTDGY
jgi:molybdopterin synthase catalytic subunit